MSSPRSSLRIVPRERTLKLFLLPVLLLSYLFNGAKLFQLHHATTAVPELTRPSCPDKLKTGGMLFVDNATLPNVPGMKEVKSSEIDSAHGRADTSFCQSTKRIRYLHHFPHYLQFVLRCWSFFQTNPRENRVISLPSDIKFFSFILEESDTAFQRGINEMLLDYGISIEKSTSDFGRGNNSASVLVDIRPFCGKSKNSLHDCDGYWMESPEHAREFRRQAMASLRLTETHRTCGNDVPRIAILNRRKSRSLVDATGIAEAIGKEFGMKEAPPVAHFEDASFRDQVEFFSETDVLISPHGAQLSGIPFMPPGGAILELHPVGYVLPQFFGSLSASSGIDHAYIGETKSGNTTEETARWTSERDMRVEARGRNICMSTSEVVRGVKKLVRRWKERCNLQRTRMPL